MAETTKPNAWCLPRDSPPSLSRVPSSSRQSRKSPPRAGVARSHRCPVVVCAAAGAWPRKVPTSRRLATPGPPSLSPSDPYIAFFARFVREVRGRSRGLSSATCVSALRSIRSDRAGFPLDLEFLVSLRILRSSAAIGFDVSAAIAARNSPRIVDSFLLPIIRLSPNDSALSQCAEMPRPIPCRARPSLPVPSE